MKPFFRIHLLFIFAVYLASCSSTSTEKKEPLQDGIVSLAPNVTEMLFALNLGERVVGVTTACDHPEEAKGIKTVGGFMTPQFEAILASGATVVVGMEGGVPEKEIARLKTAGKEVILLRDKSVNDVLASLETLGEQLGVVDGAKTLRTALERELKPSPIAKVEGRARVLLVISRDPLMVAGPNTFVGELMELAGLENAVKVGALPYPTWNRENLIASNPDWIIEATMKEATAEGPAPWTSLSSVNAVKHQQIRTVNPDWVLRPGPRMSKGVQALREALAPLKQERR